MARGHQTTGGDQLLTEQPQGCRDRVNNGVTIPVTKRDCFYSLINNDRAGWKKQQQEQKYLVYNGVTMFLTVISNRTSILVANYRYQLDYNNGAAVKETVTVVK